MEGAFAFDDLASITKGLGVKQFIPTPAYSSLAQELCLLVDMIVAIDVILEPK